MQEILRAENGGDLTYFIEYFLDLLARSLDIKKERERRRAQDMTYIYDHLDAFRLLICKSQGTRYETFLHDLAAEEEKTTMAMMALFSAACMPVFCPIVCQEETSGSKCRS